jgi:hypothetical protein
VARFPHPSKVVVIYGSVSCVEARKVMSALESGHAKTTFRGPESAGPIEADGWHCGQGAGGAWCGKGEAANRGYRKYIELLYGEARAATASALSLAVPAEAAASAHVCGTVVAKSYGQPGPVSVTKGHVSCGEAVRVIRNLSTDRHPQQFPLNVGGQTETYVDGWMCDGGHMGVLSCWQGSEYNGKPRRSIEWDYDPNEGPAS